MRALGLDWSGGKAAPRKIWAALIEVGERGEVGEVGERGERGERGELSDRGDLVELWRPFAGAAGPREIAERFAAWLRRQRFDVAGLDFCFGLEARQLEALGLPRSGPAALGAELRRRFADADAFRAAVGPERRRAADALAPFAPTNLRMYRQTFWGLCAMAEVTEPVAPWARGPRTLFEVLPRRRAAALCGRVFYKDAAGTRAERRRLLRALPLRVPPRLAAPLLEDADGDALDAVLAALEAAAAGSPQVPPAAIESGEGFLYGSAAAAIATAPSVRRSSSSSSSPASP